MHNAAAYVSINGIGQQMLQTIICEYNGTNTSYPGIVNVYVMLDNIYVDFKNVQENRYSLSIEIQKMYSLILKG